MSSGQLMLVIAAPASWKSFTPLPSWSSPVVPEAPETLPFEFMVGFTSPYTPSLFGSLSVEVP